MAQIIKLKRGTSAPTTSDIVDGEVAIDTSGQKLYINASGTIKEIGSTSDAALITSGSVALQEFEYTATSNQTTFSLQKLAPLRISQREGSIHFCKYNFCK